MKSHRALFANPRRYDAHNALFSAIRNCSYIASLALAMFLANDACGIPVLLFNNGPITGDSSSCDEGPTGCGGSGTWTIYDNFNLASAAVITGFDYTDFFTGGSTANYVKTNWSLWNSDPITPGSPVASGSSVAVLAPSRSAYLFTVSGLNQVLPAGVFWLGINNTTINDQVTTAASANGILAGSRLSDGVSYNYSNDSERVFRIYGNNVPEPSGCALAWTGLVAGGYLRSRARRQGTER